MGPPGPLATAVVVAALMLPGPVGADPAKVSAEMPVPGATPAALQAVAPAPVAGGPAGACAPGLPTPLIERVVGARACSSTQTAQADAAPGQEEADGSGEWEIVETPNATQGLRTHHFVDSSCVAAADCWAVGYVWNDTVFETLIQHWDGTDWTRVPSPNASSGNNQLVDVSCVSSDDCWAVGSYFDRGFIRTLALRWDGSAWSLVQTPNRSTSTDSLLGVDCLSESSCWAVGSYWTGNSHHNLIQRWDGTAWSIVPSPHPAFARHSGFAGVTCASESDCWAVGITVAEGIDQTMIQHWDGTSWSVTSSPSTSPVRNNVLYAAECASSTSCWAVGVEIADGTYQTVIEHWDGAAWSIVDSPDTAPAHHNLLTGVTCRSETECWAAGGYLAGSKYQTLTQRWDGTSWKIVRSPNTSPMHDNVLVGVSCAPGGDCWAVGAYAPAAEWQTLVQRWNGTTWRVVHSPNATGVQASVLEAMDCASATDCWAVGYTLTAQAQQTLIEHWDGRSWSIVPSPNTAASDHNHLASVECVTAIDCWAVGAYSPDGIRWQTTIQRWDGSSWAIVESPNTNAGRDNVLSGVTCVSTMDCWAVGFFQIDPNPTATAANNHLQTLVQHWDGASWELVSSPNSSATLEDHNVLNDVTCVATDDCWAVGNYAEAGGAYDADGPSDNAQKTLVLHWDGASWQTTASPNTGVADDNGLASVSCVSDSECWAVGSFLPEDMHRSLILRWDGSSWGAVASPNANPTQHNQLHSVECLPADGCWTVGYHGLDQRTLAMRNVPGGTDPTPTPSPLVVTTQVSFTPESASTVQHSDVAHLSARLEDLDGTPIEGQVLSFELGDETAPRTLTAVTRADGVATVATAVHEEPGEYALRVSYGGDATRAASADEASLVVVKEDTFLDAVLEGPGHSSLKARLSDLDTASRGISHATLLFFADDELIGTATTDDDGGASVAVPPRYRGSNRTYRVVFSGDDLHEDSSAEIRKKQDDRSIARSGGGRRPAAI